MIPSEVPPEEFEASRSPPRVPRMIKVTLEKPADWCGGKESVPLDGVRYRLVEEDRLAVYVSKHNDKGDVDRVYKIPWSHVRFAEYAFID